ncbi:hypothetical protein F5X99DRAFT_375756 [Biscogniauxia marginata]|nr:hypothetical protein F5X99DRAFT_375756 [Biscogniauxia marginata]
MEATPVGNRQTRLHKRRSQYSYLKCVDCRRDKQKCVPNDRQWPGQKCRRCQQKGFACSESQKTSTRNNTRDPLATLPVPLRSPSARTEDTSTNDCLHALNWKMMLQRILHVMGRINMDQDRHVRIWAMNRVMSESLASWPSSDFVDDFYETVANIDDTYIERLSPNQDRTREIEPIFLRIVARSMGPTHSWDFFPPWYECQNSRVPFSVDELDGSGETLTALDAQLTLVKSESLHHNEEILMSMVEKYDSMLKKFWENNRRLCGQKPDVFSDIPESIMEPFLHDAHFSELLTNTNDVKLLVKVFGKFDPRYIIGQDSLGRTLLHVAVENFDPADVKIVLHEKININIQDIFGRTALHIACEAGYSHRGWCQLEIINTLLQEESLDIHAKDGLGFLAIDYAIQNRRVDILHMFEYRRHFQPDSDIVSLIDAAIPDLEAIRSTFRTLFRDHQKRKQECVGE